MDWERAPGVGPGNGLKAQVEPGAVRTAVAVEGKRIRLRADALRAWNRQKTGRGSGSEGKRRNENAHRGDGRTVTLAFNLRPVPVAIAAMLSLAVGGCGMSSLTSGIGGGMFGSSDAAKTTASTGGVTEEAMLTAAKAEGPASGGGAEVAAGCPRFTIWTRDSNVTIYEPGRAGDALAVMHRGEITKTARECRVEAGRVTVKYGFSGRVLLGPRGQSGTVSLPLNVQVNDSKRAPVAADKMKIDVAVALDKPIGYFSAVREVTFPISEGARPGEYEVLVSFDRTVPGAG